MAINQGSAKGFLFSLDSTEDISHRLDFQFNPTTIKESRGVKYNYSEAQGQHLALAQFGMLNPTKITFDLFMFHHGGLSDKLASVRRLTLPKMASKLTHYDQVSPHIYMLSLGGYGHFTGMVDSTEINTTQYDKETLVPIRFTASISFTCISSGLEGDVTRVKSLGGF